MRCIGMSKKQIIHFVTLEALIGAKRQFLLGLFLESLLHG